jgi:hypothetical protein
MSAEAITVELTKAEALVLFEWLSRTEEARFSIIEDPAEDEVLSRVQGQLETTLVEPFAQNYQDLLARARKEVKESI